MFMKILTVTARLLIAGCVMVAFGVHPYFGSAVCSMIAFYSINEDE